MFSPACLEDRNQQLGGMLPSHKALHLTEEQKGRGLKWWCGKAHIQPVRCCWKVFLLFALAVYSLCLLQPWRVKTFSSKTILKVILFKVLKYFYFGDTSLSCTLTDTTGPKGHPLPSVCVQLKINSCSFFYCLLNQTFTLTDQCNLLFCLLMSSSFLIGHQV